MSLGTGGRSRYPVVANAVQAGIMGFVHRERRPVSRAELSEVLGSGRGRISVEVGELVRGGLLAEDGLAQSEGGRRSALLGIPRSAGLVAAVDIGARHVSVALTTLGSEILAYERLAVDVREGPRPVLGRVGEALRGQLAGLSSGSEEVLAIGVGVPGPVERSSGRLTSPPIMPGWHRFPITNAFAGEYAAPVFVDNDVNIMALGEHWGGVARGVEDVVFVKIATGIGSGILIGGRIHRGAQGCAGDFGHICVDPAGPICTCGNAGCLEAMAAGPAIALGAEAAARRGESPGLLAVLEERGELSARDVGEAAARGDYPALTTIRGAGRLIGQTLAAVVSVLNPSMIVIGGGVSHIGNALLAEIRSAVYERSLPLATRNLPVVMSELDDRAGVVGASVMAVEGVLVYESG